MITTKKKSLKAGHLVDSSHADTVIRNYKQERWAHNSKRIGKEDSLSVWYSIEELEEYLAMAREHGADGIRMCFGVYGNDYNERPGYAGRQTLVLVATKEKKSGRKNVHISTENGPTVLAYNSGTICPPFCSSDDGLGITIVDNGSDGLIIA